MILKVRKVLEEASQSETFLALVRSQVNNDYAIRCGFQNQVEADKWARRIAHKIQSNIEKIRSVECHHHFDIQPFKKEDID
jgi:hypothetical protein